MKIAVPTKGNSVDDHFGHCAHYTVYTVENNTVTGESRVESPAGCGCKTNIAKELAAQGVTLMLAGNMGQGAVNKLSAAGMSVIRGCSGETRSAVDRYLAGSIADSGEGCAGHADDHECNH